MKENISGKQLRRQIEEDHQDDISNRHLRKTLEEETASHAVYPAKHGQWISRLELIASTIRSTLPPEA